MTPGSIVIYLADPLDAGKMIVLSVEDDGFLLCEAIHPDSNGEFYRDKFQAQELELFERWAGAAL